jgi:serine/threonine protein kinase
MMCESGQVLKERYILRQTLGKRTGRRTLLAEDSHTREQVIIKLLLFGNDFEWDDLKLFKREVEILKTLSHPSIPKYVDYFDVDFVHSRGFALVQNYIAAKSLADYLKTGRTFSELEIQEIARRLLEILQYLHGRQPPVIHRDIKPSNILLSDRSGYSVGQVYLVDFGSVQTIAAREGRTITVAGTYGYMPPEQFGDRAVPASDLYSLGATLIHLVTGMTPSELPQQNLRIQFAEQVTGNITSHFVNWLHALTNPALELRIMSAHQALSLLKHKRKDNFLYKNYLPEKITKSCNGYDLVVEKSSKHLEIRKELYQSKKQKIDKLINGDAPSNSKWLVIKILCFLTVLAAGILSYFMNIIWLAFVILAPIILMFFIGIFQTCWLIATFSAISMGNIIFSCFYKMVKGRPPGCYIQFNSEENCFNVCNYFPRIEITGNWGRDSISSIRCVAAIQKTYHYGGYGTQTCIRDEIIIHAKRRWELLWELSEQESQFVATEIRRWLYSHRSKH